MSQGQTAIENWATGVVNGTSAVNAFAERLMEVFTNPGLLLTNPLYSVGVGPGPVLSPVPTVPMRPR